MIGRYKPAQRFAPLRPRTLAEHMAQQGRTAERKIKRQRKRRELGMGPGRKTIIAQLDHLFSLYIRRRDRRVAAGRCVICLTRPIEHCFHWITRANQSTRWHEDNACGSCRGCNLEETHRPMKYRAIHVGMIGEEKRCWLEMLSRQSAHFTVPDLIGMRDDLKRKLEGK